MVHLCVYWSNYCEHSQNFIALLNRTRLNWQSVCVDHIIIQLPNHVQRVPSLDISYTHPDVGDVIMSLEGTNAFEYIEDFIKQPLRIMSFLICIEETKQD